MKSKIIYAAILALSMFSLNYNAQTFSNEKLEAIKKNCFYSLNHENLGVQESAIFVTIQFKSRYPQKDHDKFVDALNNLIQDSASPIISYKASLAKLYFVSNELFRDVEVSSILDEEKVYSEIAEKINQIRLSAKF